MIIKGVKISKSFFRNKEESNFFEALKETNIELEENKFIEIIGKSGSGKSTMLNILSGLLSPSTGNVYYDDMDIYEMPDSKRSKYRNENIGIIPQGQTGLQNLTVLENVLLPSLLYSKEDKTEEALNLLKKLDIYDLKDSYPNELSGGELRRMAIARSLIMNPKIIFADEPTGDLDEENTKIVLDILKDIVLSGKTFVMVTHDKDALKYADIVYKMTNGILTKEK